jgi:hypothetical protein
MSQITLNRTTLKIGLLQIAIIILIIATALIHLDKTMAMGFFGHAGGAPAGGHHAGGPPMGGGGPSGPMLLLFENLPLLFFLNFIGYIVLGVALYLPFLQQFQRIIRWLLIVFTAVTIIAYFMVLGLSPNTLGLVDKAIEVVLVILLLIEDFKSARSTVAKG